MPIPAPAVLSTLALPKLSLRQVLLAAAVAVPFVLFLVQTWRIEAQPIRLPFGMAIGHEGYEAQVSRLEAELRALRKAQEEAELLDAVERAQLRNDYLLLAEKANAEIEEARRQERARTDRFIARGGVSPHLSRPGPGQAQAAGPNRRADHAHAADQPSVLDDAAGPSAHTGRPGTFDPVIVRVFAEDVRICTDNTLIAEQAQRWAADLAERTSTPTNQDQANADE